MRCAVYMKSNTMTRSRLSSKSKPVSVTRVLPTTSQSEQVTVVDTVTCRQSTTGYDQQDRLTHKPARSEVVKRGGHARGSGGRHLQPPSGNNTKLKHECPFDGCPWRFATPYKLRRHIKSHTKETPFQCKECGRGFSVRYNLLMHIQTIHSTPHKYKCPVSGCKDAFHTQPRLNGHLRKIHKKDWKQLQMEQSKEPSTAKRTISTDSLLSPDDLVIDNSDSMELTTSSKWHLCADCGKEFSSQAKLSAHMKTHLGNFHCTVEGCSRSFQSSDKLTKHVNSSHKHCPSEGCNRVFLNQSQLKSHLRLHNNSKYACPRQDCNLKFDNEVDFNDHLTVHKGYSIPCPYKQCNLTFPTQKRLGLHYRVAHLNNKETTDMLLSNYEATLSKANGSSDGDNFMDTLVLPDLKVEDVEAVMSEHTQWTGDQIDTFLKSIDMEELDCGSSLKTSSLSGYDSDSGYSTHEVSPMAGGATHYSSALSPAITPVTPSSILTSSSTSSPIPFCLCHDDMFPLHSGGTGNADHHFFGGSDLPLLSHPSSSSEQLFQSPSLCPTTPSSPQHHSLPTTPFQSASSPQVFVSISQPSRGCVQSVLPPISNVSDIEANRHSVTIVPNSFCSSMTCLSTETTASSVTMTHAQTSNAPHFDNFLDGYLNMLEMDNSSDKHSTDSTSTDVKDTLEATRFMESSFDNAGQDKSNDLCSNFVTKIEAGGIDCSRKSSCSSEHLPNPVCNEHSELRLVSNDTGRIVIAQVLSPPKQTQILEPANSKSTGSNSVNTRSVSGKSKGKGRHHSVSVSMKGHQKGKKKTNWPKSMNNGNLMAFRNFILGKLKQSPPTVSRSSFAPLHIDNEILPSQSVPLTPTCFSVPSDDFFNDLVFNPDTLLTASEGSMDSSSPFSHHSGSISPSPVPMSPSLESSIHFSSLSSLSSDLSPSCPESGNGNLDIDGFIQCLTVDPVSQGVKQNFNTHLTDEFCSFLKTDADPLLGGLS